MIVPAEELLRGPRLRLCHPPDGAFLALEVDECLQSDLLAGSKEDNPSITLPANAIKQQPPGSR